MSIIIKGMEMPKTWRDCVFSNGAAQCKLDNMELCGLCYRQRCPLVPVQKHGRLIDADALMLKILDYIEEYSDVDEKGWHNLKWCAMKEAEMAINDAPTIIPAEEGE